MIFTKVFNNIIQIENVKNKTLFVDVIADMRLNPIVIELFFRGNIFLELNIFLPFILQCYFAVTKSIRLNSTHYFIIKFQTNKYFNRLRLVIHQSFPFFFSFFLKIDWILTSNNLLLHFRKNPVQKSKNNYHN